jgi:c-di-GMP-related signal transduction protein
MLPCLIYSLLALINSVTYKFMAKISSVKQATALLDTITYRYGYLRLFFL